MIRRDVFRKGLSPLYLPYYDSLCGVLGEEWQPYMGLRTIEQQDALYAQGRTTEGHIVTNADGPGSPHPYGCATDWAYIENGKLIWLTKEDKRWQEFINAVEKVGLRSGSEWGDMDHAELKLAISWHVIGGHYIKFGMESAVKKIEAVMIK